VGEVLLVAVLLVGEGEAWLEEGEEV
jgi:hypothetical protein